MSGGVVFYFSRAERWALVLLLALLLGGAGTLVYAKGRHAVEPEDPLLVSAAPREANHTVGLVDEGAPEAEAKMEPDARTRPPGVISLNTATVEELDALPGIGPAYAAAIVAYRERKLRETGQGFRTIDELLNVPGIGPKRFEAMKELVTP